MADSKLNINQQCTWRPGGPTIFWGASGTALLSWSREGIVPLCSVLVWPHLQHCVQLWAQHYKNDIKLLESVQRKVTKMVKGLEGTMPEEPLKSFGLSSPEQSRLRGGLMAACSSFTRGAEGQTLSSALWGQRQDPRERHGAGTGEGQAGC